MYLLESTYIHVIIFFFRLANSMFRRQFGFKFCYKPFIITDVFSSPPLTFQMKLVVMSTNTVDLEIELQKTSVPDVTLA